MNKYPIDDVEVHIRHHRLVSLALDEAISEDAMTSPWFIAWAEFTAVTGHPVDPRLKIQMTGHEPFGTHVTIWDRIDGPLRATVVKIDRGTFGDTEYVTTQLCRSTGGVSHYPGVPEGVTLGWHPDAR